MRLSTKGRQAVVAMIDVALLQAAGPVALAGISRRRGISMSYLEQMFTDLRRSGLVESTRGPGGGYTISRVLEAISVADIVRAVDSLEAEPASRSVTIAAGEQRCLTPELWSSLSQRMIEFLDSVTLKKLVDEQPADVLMESAAPRKRPVVASVKPPRPNAPNSVFQLGAFPVR